MRPRRAPQQKAKLYQSEINDSPEGVRLRFTSDTKDSKYPDSTGYVFAEREDGVEVMMVLENQDIRDKVDRTPQRKWVTLRGEGKGEGAWIVVDEEDAKDTPQPSKGRPEREPEPESDEWGKLVDDAVDITVRAVIRFRKSAILLEGEAVSRMYDTHFIGMDRRS